MKTLSFVGPAKNCGKTTAMNFVYSKMDKETTALTSIGINGERVDNFDTRVKPEIKIVAGSYFVTASDWLNNHAGKYKIVETLPPPKFNKQYVIGRAIIPFEIILEGPNSFNQVVEMKKRVKKISAIQNLLLDGSIDRQFIADPSITDSIYFSINISKSSDINSINNKVTKALNFKKCSCKRFSFIEQNITKKTKSLLFVDSKIIYKGELIPSLDNKLHKLLTTNKKTILYLAGALTTELAKKIPASSEVVLDNFTQYQTTSLVLTTVRHETNISGVFIIERGGTIPILPANIPVYNIYQEAADAIRI